MGFDCFVPAKITLQAGPKAISTSAPFLVSRSRCRTWHDHDFIAVSIDCQVLALAVNTDHMLHVKHVEGCLTQPLFGHLASMFKR